MMGVALSSNASYSSCKPHRSLTIRKYDIKNTKLSCERSDNQRSTTRRNHPVPK